MDPNETIAYVSGRVIKTRCHGLTYYGNPMMSIMLDSHPCEWFRISDNSGLVYGIDNREYREHSHDFKLTKAGRISGYHRLTEPNTAH